MNILLIKPYWPYPYSKGEYTYNRIWPPLCLANCATLLEKEGYNVKILDAHAQRITPDKIANYIKGYDKVFITSSTLDKWQCPNIDITLFLETVRYIRQLTDEVYIMGYHGTVEPEKILELSKAKAVIRGEPEYTVIELCRNNDLFKITGISFRNNGRFISNPARELFDLKTLSIPAYHFLNTDKYSYEILGKNFALFETSRGCNYGCKFCNKIMYGKGLRTKSIEQIIEELRTAIERYNVKTGYFIDLEFIYDREIVEGLCKFLIEKKYNFVWCCQTRPDSLDIEILKKMKKAGCKLIHLGIESGIQKFLDYLNKNITIEKIERSVRMCKQIGIRTLAFSFFGLPNETESDRKEIFKFIKELNTNFVSFHKMVPYKETRIYHSGFGLNFKSNNIDKFIRNAFIKYYLRPSYLFKLNPFIILKGLQLFCKRIITLK
jgi:radical SAM superfamily enzyme YgiQ (UPF0313 family)